MLFLSGFSLKKAKEDSLRILSKSDVVAKLVLDE